MPLKSALRRVLVTGATGVVGAPLVRLLLSQGVQVSCLVRSPEAAAALPTGAEPVLGDLLQPDTLPAAVYGREAVFHAAGLIEQWVPDPGQFHRVNVDGTRALIEAAQEAGVRRFVHVSTQDTFDLTQDPFDETQPSHDPAPTAYEWSKICAQTLVDAAGQQGMWVVSLHPCAVYGPGARRPSGLTSLLLDLAAHRAPILMEGSLSVVFNQDVARALWLAAQSAQDGAPSGRKFLLAESHRTLANMASEVRLRVPTANIPLVLPVRAARVLASVSAPIARLLNRPPLVTHGLIKTLTRTGRASAALVRQELGWQPTPFGEGLCNLLQIP